MGGRISYLGGIVKDGLVLDLDAAKIQSYPRTGTLWNDLSGNGYVGTLTNGPTFNSDNGGSIVFDGTNDLVLLPTNLYTQNNNPFSFSIWIKTTQVTGGTILGQQDGLNPNSANGWVPAVYLLSNGKIRTETFWTNSPSNAIISANSYNDNAWHNIICTYGSNTERTYIDGNLIGTLNPVSQVSYSATYYYFLGAGYAAQRGLTTNYFNGNISQFLFYNKQLSATEILQNYNATKGRYL